MKRLASAKSRLGLPPPRREALAFALFQRTLDISLQCLPASQIFVLTADQRVVAHAAEQHVAAIPDHAGNLNAALHSALHWLAQGSPPNAVAVMVSDLPLLTAGALEPVLHDADQSWEPRHVADHHGTGTTFVSIPPQARLPMLFGPDSAARFAAAGSIAILGAPRGITHDLDVDDDFPASYLTLKESACLSTPSP